MSDGADLYEHDILLWSEQQAELLRRLARGERVNGVDWAHVVEEIDAWATQSFTPSPAYCARPSSTF